MPRKQETKQTVKVPKAEERKNKKGNNTWRCRVYIGTAYRDGKAVKQYLTATGSTEKEAVEKALHLKTTHMNGLADGSLQGGSVTLETAINRYIDSRKSVLSPTTICGYWRIHDNRFQAYMGKRIKDINFQRMVNEEAATGISPKYLKNAWGLVSAALKDNGMKVDDIRLAQVPPADKQWLTPEQIPVFIKAVKGKPCEIPALLALCGLRRSEIYGLTWEHGIDLAGEKINIRGSRVVDTSGQLVAKKANKNTSSTRTIPFFFDEVKEALEAVPQDKRYGYIYNQHFNTLLRQINTVCEKNDLPRVGIHGLRHSFASLCLHLGLNEQTCMMYGGWNDHQTMRKIYQHISEKDLTDGAKIIRQFNRENKA